MRILWPEKERDSYSVANPSSGRARLESRALFPIFMGLLAAGLGKAGGPSITQSGPAYPYLQWHVKVPGCWGLYLTP